MHGFAFGERLAEARLAAGLSPFELARRAGLRDSDIHRWERVKTMNVQIGNVRALARALNVSADYLLGLIDDPAPLPARELASTDALAAREAEREAGERRRRDRRRRERRTR